MEWFFIDMPSSSLKDGAYHRFCRAFQRAFINAGAPADLALFAVKNGEARRRLYLTPSSIRYVPELIRLYDGHRCVVPDASTVTLVYGVPRAASLLSPRDEQPEHDERSKRSSMYQIVRGRRAASTG